MHGLNFIAHSKTVLVSRKSCFKVICDVQSSVNTAAEIFVNCILCSEIVNRVRKINNVQQRN